MRQVEPPHSLFLFRTLPNNSELHFVRFHPSFIDLFIFRSILHLLLYNHLLLMKDRIVHVFLLLFFVCCCEVLSAQRTLNLQQCVDIAYAKSLQIQNADLNIEMANVNALQAKHNRYPSLNGSTTYGYNVGRTIDPTTNVFANQTSSFQRAQLNTSVTLFQGGVINNSIEQSGIRQIAAKYRKDALLDNIGLQVAQNYLNALLADESRALAEIQIELTRTQIERLDKLINAGTVPANDRLELEAQSARDQQQLINSENTYEIAILNLKNLLLIDVGESINLKKLDPNLVEIDDAILDMPLEEVYYRALNYQPSIRADSMDLIAADFDTKISEGRLLPSLSIGGSVSTNFSSLSREVVGAEDVINTTPVVINGMSVDVGFPGTNFLFDDTPYFDQLDNNLGYGFGLTLSLPIYNNYASRINVERSEIGFKQVHTQNEINRQTLKATIQNAVAQARAAREVYLAAQKSVGAQENSFNNLEKKLAVGAANNFEFITAKNNLSISENSLTQAKYDYIFKLKVIDYYLGNPLKL